MCRKPLAALITSGTIQRHDRKHPVDENFTQFLARQKAKMVDDDSMADKICPLFAWSSEDAYLDAKKYYDQ